MIRTENDQPAGATSVLRGAIMWGSLCAVLVLAGCGSTGTVERWHMTDEQAPASGATAPGTPAQAVRVVFFRQAPASERAAQPINLYINGQYQASLVGSTYTEQSLCPGQQRVAVHFNDVQRRYVTKAEGLALAIGQAPTQYFRVTEDAAGQAGVRPASADEARAAGSLRLLQAHTVPRVVRNGCARG